MHVPYKATVSLFTLGSFTVTAADGGTHAGERGVHGDEHQREDCRDSRRSATALLSAPRQSLLIVFGPTRASE
jgi:hypothetical protein